MRTNASSSQDGLVSAGTADISKKETRALAQRDEKDKSAKTEEKLVGAIQIRSCKQEGKYGLRGRSGANTQASHLAIRPSTTKAGLRNSPKVCLNVVQGDPGTTKAGLRNGRPTATSNPDISMTEEETEAEDNSSQSNPQREYLVQATLVPPSSLDLESETAADIPRAEVVDLENLLRRQTSAEEPSPNRTKVCAGAIGFLVLVLVAVVAAVVLRDPSSNNGHPESTPPELLQPTPYPTSVPTTSPTSPPQPTQPPVPVTSVEWFGQVYPIENTTEIDLWDHHLQGTLPTELGLLTQLTKLRLDGNNLNGTIPTELAQLWKATFLRLDENDLVGRIPSQLGLLTALTRLTFGINQLTGTIPTQLGLLTSLEGLWGATNMLEGSIPSELGLLTAATTLTLQRNRLTGAVPTELGSMNLTTLLLYNNRLEGSLPTQVCQLSRLSDLSTDCAPDPFPLNCSCGTLCKCF